MAGLAAVCIPEVCMSQPWIEISRRTLVAYFHSKHILPRCEAHWIMQQGGVTVIAEQALRLRLSRRTAAAAAGQPAGEWWLASVCTQPSHRPTFTPTSLTDWLSQNMHQQLEISRQVSVRTHQQVRKTRTDFTNDRRFVLQTLQCINIQNIQPINKQAHKLIDISQTLNLLKINTAYMCYNKSMSSEHEAGQEDLDWRH